jgi:hypothetical protein
MSEFQSESGSQRSDNDDAALILQTPLLLEPLFSIFS